MLVGAGIGLLVVGVLQQMKARNRVDKLIEKLEVLSATLRSLEKIKEVTENQNGDDEAMDFLSSIMKEKEAEPTRKYGKKDIDIKEYTVIYTDSDDDEIVRL